MLLPSILWSSCFIFLASASVTVYYQRPLGDATGTAAPANSTVAAYYDPTVLTPPPVPSPAIPTQFSLQLDSTAATVKNLSIPLSGHFLGFSIEFSVINQLIGLNASFLQVSFLNLMSSVAQRSGQVNIRVGGNTQDYATLVPSLPDGEMIQKEQSGNTDPTETPTLDFTAEVLYMLGNVSALVNIHWYLGIPLNDTAHLRMGIAEVGEAVLGPKLIGFQVGNEPDLYSAHGHRNSSYSPSNYFNDFGLVVEAVNDDADIPTKNNLIGPNLSGTWTPESVWNTGFIPAFINSLGALAVEHYPNDNCNAEYGIGSPVNVQNIFASYLNHNAGKSIIAPYLNSTQIAQTAHLPFLMFETNTASCGGFPGLSDSFGSALWMLDYALQMAYSNFSGAMMHVSGEDVYYNPFQPPPRNESTYNQWTVRPIFYAALAVAEALGNSNTSQIVDLQANTDNIYTPAYAIYEDGECARLALLNYVTDPTGASAYTATFSIGGGATGDANGIPASVQVKYLLAPSVSEKVNVTWAGQTYGGPFASDGRIQGDIDVQTVNCDQSANTCAVQVPAPGFALVFLTSAAFSESNPTTTQTFSTTSLTSRNTATVPAAVLATSNGHSGSTWRLGSTSPEDNGTRALAIPDMAGLIAMLLGKMVVDRVLT